MFCRIRRIALFAGMLALVVRPAWGAEPAEKLPEGAKVVALRAVPESITLEGPFAYNQLLLTAELASGEQVDATRLAELASTPEVVEVTPQRIVLPRKAGAGTLRFTLAGQAVEVKVAVAGVEDAGQVDFIRDVNPVLSKVGCNAGTCHGAKDGKNGFKLSLRGYDPLFDVRALVDDLGARRVNRASPDKSLMLLKATGAVPHVGGQVIEPDSNYYKIVRSWIADGSQLNLDTPRVAKIEVRPKNPIIAREGMRQQMRVVATYTDGAQRDVTAEAFIESGNTDCASATTSGVVTALRRGEAPVLVRYEGAYAATTVTVMGDRSGFVWEEPPANNEIDRLVARKLERMKILSSPLCSDAEFIRRVYLDLTGLPPTPEQVRAFLADTTPTQAKRDALIDQLIGNPEYVAHWTNKWADLLMVNRKYLGQPGAVAFRDWIRQAVAENMPYDEFARHVLTASGSNRENPAASYYKILRTPAEIMENTTHLFLGVRFNCNKCHDHPFERWTQDQYYHLTAYFAQTGLKKDPASGDKKIGGTAVEGAKPLYEIVFDKPGGEVKHDRTGQVAPPEFPYPADFEKPAADTRRERLAAWITSPDNQYFATSYVNRIWGYLLGTGIIEPLDDIRAGNPPTNPELLEYLTREFVQHDFDVRHLMRLICKSRTYQLSVATNRWNEDDQINYSHAEARRLPAEVLFDAVHRVTGSTPKLPGLPAGARAAQLPDVGVKLPSGFLDQFGRPARESACECERTSDLMLGPVMALINGPTIATAINDPNNAIARLVKEHPDDAELVEKLFMRILNRPPTEQEIAAGKAALHGLQKDHQQVVTMLEEYKQQSAARRARAQQAFEERRKTAQAALDAYQTQLPAKLATWEEAQRSAAWTPLTFDELKASNGATLTAETPASDQPEGTSGAIFVTGKNGKGHYLLTSATDVEKITGIRLELLADDRLPSKGPGRAENGNFVLSELTLEAAPADQPDKFTKVKLQNAQANFSQNNYDVKTAIDGKAPDRNNGWASSPKLGVDRVAVFETAGDVGSGAGTRLRFKLDQQFQDGKHTIGRFRVSVTRSPRPIALGGLPEKLAAILDIPREKRTPDQQKQLMDHYRQTDATLKRLTAALQNVQSNPPRDNRLAELESTVAISAKQLENERLTGAQDLAWALINSPAFLFNH